MYCIKYFLIILSILFCGCGQQESISKKDSQNTKNNAELRAKEYLYGLGGAATFEEAKAQAIKDLSTSLLVSVSHTSSAMTQQKNDTLTMSGSSNVFLESKIKNLPAVEIIKQSKKGGMHEVRVRVDKNVLLDQILNKINITKMALESMLESCNSVGFDSYFRFKNMLKDYKSDVSLYQIVSKNQAYESSSLVSYSEAINSLPKYRVEMGFQREDFKREDFKKEDSINSQVKNIVFSELSKLIKIDKDSTRELKISANNKNGFIYFNFYDCTHKLEVSKKIDTYINYKDLHTTKAQKRLGAVVYKGLEE